MYPTLRGILILLLAAPVIALGTWLPALGWLSLAVISFIVGVLVADYRAAEPVDRFQVSRQNDTKLSLGEDNPVRLKVRSLRRRTTVFWVRDEPPADFRVSRRILSGQVRPRQIWEDVYTVRPVERGDYTFGDINLRWLGPLGLVVRQGKVKAGAPVKVYPNLLDVRRYDLLLRRNRLQEVGLRNARLFGELRQ